MNLKSLPIELFLCWKDPQLVQNLSLLNSDWHSALLGRNDVTGYLLWRRCSLLSPLLQHVHAVHRLWIRAQELTEHWDVIQQKCLFSLRVVCIVGLNPSIEKIRELVRWPELRSCFLAPHNTSDPLIDALPNTNSKGLSVLMLRTEHFTCFEGSVFPAVRTLIVARGSRHALDSAFWATLRSSFPNVESLTLEGMFAVHPSELVAWPALRECVYEDPFFEQSLNMERVQESQRRWNALLVRTLRVITNDYAARVLAQMGFPTQVRGSRLLGAGI